MSPMDAIEVANRHSPASGDGGKVVRMADNLHGGLVLGHGVPSIESLPEMVNGRPRDTPLRCAGPPEYRLRLQSKTASSRPAPRCWPSTSTLKQEEPPMLDTAVTRLFDHLARRMSALCLAMLLSVSAALFDLAPQ